MRNNGRAVRLPTDMSGELHSPAPDVLRCVLWLYTTLCPLQRISVISLWVSLTREHRYLLSLAHCSSWNCPSDREKHIQQMAFCHPADVLFVFYGSAGGPSVQLQWRRGVRDAAALPESGNANVPPLPGMAGLCAAAYLPGYSEHRKLPGGHGGTGSCLVQPVEPAYPVLLHKAPGVLPRACFILTLPNKPPRPSGNGHSREIAYRSRR